MTGQFKQAMAHGWAATRTGRAGVILVVVLIATACTLVAGAAAQRSPQAIRQPLHYGGQLFSCPDPDVFQLPGRERWVAACTSDYGQLNPVRGRAGYAASGAALPIYETTGPSFAHWRLRNFIFPPGHLPPAALAPRGNWPGGRYWAPEIHRIGANWVAYFAAEINTAEFHRVHPGRSPGGDFGLFVAWTPSLFGGHWNSRLLHYRGQFNAVPGNDREERGGVIDPSVARNPQTGRLQIVWAKQANQIFEGELTPNGLAMRDTVHRVITANRSWMCPGASCVIEGPVLAADPVNAGVMDLFANAAGTWDGTYRTAVAVSVDPEHVKWALMPEPIDVGNTGFGLQGPGIGSQPFASPDGSWLMAVHLMTHRTHNSQERYLGFVSVNYDDPRGQTVVAPGSIATDGLAAGLATHRSPLALLAPTINQTGRPEPVVVYGRRALGARAAVSPR